MVQLSRYCYINESGWLIFAMFRESRVIGVREPMEEGYFALYTTDDRDLPKKIVNILFHKGE